MKPQPSQTKKGTHMKTVLRALLSRGKYTLLAVVAVLTLSSASVALAGSGVNGVFNLGVTNTVNALTTLVSGAAGVGPAGPLLRIDNNSTNAAATALELLVEPGKAPMKTNSGTKVTNLNADKLDGQDSTTFATKSGFGVTVIPSSGASLGGPLPLERTFTSKGGTTTLIEVTGTAYRSSAVANGAGRIGMRVKVDGLELDNTAMLTNELNSHKTLPTAVGVIKNLPAGTHTLRIEPMYDSVCDTANDTVTDYCTSTDNDYFRALVQEIPAT
jgi:hypothetical protein